MEFSQQYYVSNVLVIQVRSQDFSWSEGKGGGGAYIKTRNQIIINELYATQLLKTHEAEFQPTDY